MDNIQLNKLFKIWHLGLLLLLLLLVSVGGFTRLTNSGLSITNWEIFTGILPPLNDQDWIKYFSLYKTIPQYKKINFGMNLAEFKFIFWWEYAHRLLARIIGIIFLLPLIYFIIKKIIINERVYYFIFILLLFLFQGFLGWFMVKSGLTLHTDVSHFRLAAHLTTALLIISLIFWSYLNINSQTLTIQISKNKFLIFLLLLVFIQIIFGAFTSGLDAGLIYQTWPKMNLNFIAEEVSLQSFFSSEIFYDRSHVQFVHRIIAYSIFILYVIFYLKKIFSNYKYKNYLHIILFFLFLQILLGIFTLISGLNIYLAAFHQLTSILLVMSILLLIYKLKY